MQRDIIDSVAVLQDVPQVLLLMSGGQFIVCNVGSFEHAHAGVVHAPTAAPAPPATLPVQSRPSPPPPLAIPIIDASDAASDSGADPEVRADTEAGSTARSRRGRGGDASVLDDDDDVFDDENENERENTSPPLAGAGSSAGMVQPLGPSVSQHVRPRYSLVFVSNQCCRRILYNC